MRYVKLARSVLRQRVTEDGRVENLAATDIVAFLSAESRAGQLHVTHDRGLGQTSIRNKPPTVTLLPHLDRRRRCG